MKTLKEQTDDKIAAGRKAKPEFMKGVDDIINKAKAFEQGKEALKIGEKATDRAYHHYPSVVSNTKKCCSKIDK